MYKDKKFCFAGNRFFVLKEMLDAGLNVIAVYAVGGSYLASELLKLGIGFQVIESKEWLVRQLLDLNFDYFISNGLPIILPISKLSANRAGKFINIHPSFLPDLRGVDPVPGSLLYGRNSGATCHYMNDRIDAGEIIAQVLIPYSADIDCGLLYQLSFAAERQAFRMALARQFEGGKRQTLDGNEIYYRIKEDDKKIDFHADALAMLRQIMAFNTRSQGAYFFYEGYKVVVRDGALLSNPFLTEISAQKAENEVLFIYEGKVVIKKGDACFILKQVDGIPTSLVPGRILS